MRAGRLNQRITITEPSASLDSAGQRVAGASVACWAEVSPVKVAESAGGPRASAVLAAASMQAMIRYRTVTPSATVTWDAQTYAITGQDYNHRRTWLTLYLKRR
jgi:head-tail adaptor